MRVKNIFIIILIFSFSLGQGSRDEVVQYEISSEYYFKDIVGWKETLYGWKSSNNSIPVWDEIENKRIDRYTGSNMNIFGLEILAKSIETNKKNFTRFIILSKSPEKNNLRNKATLFFQLPHDPGALAKILNILAVYSINLTKIQSVPIVGKPYEYNFHVDMIWELYTNFQKAIAAIKEISVNLQILGEYEKGIVDFKNEK